MKFVGSDEKNGQFLPTSLNMCNNTKHIEQTVHMNTNNTKHIEQTNSAHEH